MIKHVNGCIKIQKSISWGHVNTTYVKRTEDDKMIGKKLVTYLPEISLLQIIMLITFKKFTLENNLQSIRSMCWALSLRAWTL